MYKMYYLTYYFTQTNRYKLPNNNYEPWINYIFCRRKKFNIHEIG